MSRAKDAWDTECTARLDQLERIHATIRGAGRGRQWYTGQLNRSLIVALVAQFQVYCRDLHDEAIDVYLAQANPRQVGVLHTLLNQNRKLDTQNPRRSSLGSDFAVRAHGRRANTDLDRLDELVEFRNAIVHGDEPRIQSLVSCYQTRITLNSYRRFRQTLDRLVRLMDTVVATKLADNLRVRPPW